MHVHLRSVRTSLFLDLAGCQRNCFSSYSIAAQQFSCVSTQERSRRVRQADNFSPVHHNLLALLATFSLCCFIPPGGAEESILIAAPVKATFQTTTSGGAGAVTHYILSAVPRDEIFEPVDRMADLIQDSTSQVGRGWI